MEIVGFQIANTPRAEKFQINVNIEANVAVDDDCINLVLTKVITKMQFYYLKGQLMGFLDYHFSKTPHKDLILNNLAKTITDQNWSLKYRPHEEIIAKIDHWIFLKRSELFKNNSQKIGNSEKTESGKKVLSDYIRDRNKFEKILDRLNEEGLIKNGAWQGRKIQLAEFAEVLSSASIITIGNMTAQQKCELFCEHFKFKMDAKPFQDSYPKKKLEDMKSMCGI